MNWSKIKTILIILFLCVDAFLLTLIVNSEFKYSNIPREIVQSTTQLLNQNGITIKENIIPRQIMSAGYVNADNAIDDYYEFAKLMLGENLSEGEDNSFTSQAGSVSFDGDTFVCTLISPPYADITTVTDEKSAVTFVKNLLKKSGIDLSSAEIHTSFENDVYKLTVKNYHDKMPMFNSVLYAEIYDSTSMKLYGSWFNTKGTDSSDNTLKNVTGILIDFMSSRLTNAPIEISALEIGYSLLESSTFHKSAVLIPVWQISTDSGEVFYLDARTSE